MKQFRPGNMVKGNHDSGFYKHVATQGHATVSGHNKSVKLCGRGDSYHNTTDHKR